MADSRPLDSTSESGNIDENNTNSNELGETSSCSNSMTSQNGDDDVIAVPPCVEGTNPSDTLVEEKNMSNSSAAPVRRKKKRSLESHHSTGRWTEEEHIAFLEGLGCHGREWKKVAAMIPSRSAAQVRSHAQKYFAKLRRDEEFGIFQAHYQEQLCQFSSTNHEDIVTDGSHRQSPDSIEMLSPSGQAVAERIASNPEAVQEEVMETLERLRERYRVLQSRLLEQQGRQAKQRKLDEVPARIDKESKVESLGEDERIALDVLRGELPSASYGPSSDARKDEMELDEGSDDCSSQSASHSSSSSSTSDEDENKFRGNPI